MKRTIYLMHPIQNSLNVSQWYKTTIENLHDYYCIYHPMIDTHSKVSTDKVNNVNSNSAIVSRDLQYASSADILFVDFTNSNTVSIGCCFELAIGYWQHKHIVAVIPNDNIHQHCFIQEACSIVFTNYDNAIDYLKMIAQL